MEIIKLHKAEYPARPFAKNEHCSSKDRILSVIHRNFEAAHYVLICSYCSWGEIVESFQYFRGVRCRQIGRLVQTNWAFGADKLGQQVKELSTAIKTIGY